MIIIKVGGGEKTNWDGIANDLVNLSQLEKIVLVHGASVRRDEVAQKLGAPTKTVVSPSGISSVYTDNKAIEVFLMVYAGLTNKQIVAKLQKYGLNAIGLSGVDGKLWQAKRKNDLLVAENGKVKLIKDNLTGRVERINTDLINLLVENNYIPVLCPPAISFENEIVNTDNDLATAQMAESLGVKEIVVLFEAPGMLENFPDEKSVINNISKKDLELYMEQAKGRMKKKILGAKKAFEMGVTKIYWGDSRIEHPVLSAMEGKGTVID
ncbi:TPA: [LysW]-aminoadipate kinase [Candidatus Woesearchaeota archaeon]|uniref:Acetylglutamate kinase n=1 Tax=Candidatus Gottesmanbacteria bacterium GW2011_GWC2_39_8 TaxID=1618450 RepID=A0A0G0PUS2_9BACT|nr:MAG: Acetylglutamate kinase [Candidatus Gottesmanbacteria bacterium GW2011_GWC2_39_8]HIH13434.1 [LysW]-aminoadipate kinase [Candidatus Woesearchaeota archaeon]